MVPNTELQEEIKELEKKWYEEQSGIYKQLKQEEKRNIKLEVELEELEEQIKYFYKIKNLNPQQMVPNIFELQDKIVRTIEELKNEFELEQKKASIIIQKTIPKYEERIKTTEQDIERILYELKDSGNSKSVTKIKKALDLYKNQDTSHGFINVHLYNSFKHLKESETTLSKEIVETLTSYGQLCIYLDEYKKYEKRLEDYNKDIISPIEALIKNIDKSLNDKELIVTLEKIIRILFPLLKY